MPEHAGKPRDAERPQNQAKQAVAAMTANQAEWKKYVQSLGTPEGAMAARINGPLALGHGAQGRDAQTAEDHVAKDGKVTPERVVSGNRQAGGQALAREQAEQAASGGAPPPADKSREPAGPTPFSIVGGGAYATLGELEAELPGRPAGLIRIVVEADRLVHVGAECVLHFWDETRPLEIDGQGARVDGNGPQGRPTPGYFLSYRPKITGSTRDAPKQANLQVRNLSICGFVNGGIEISPVAQTAAEGGADGWAGKTVGGLDYAAWLAARGSSPERVTPALSRQFGDAWEREQGGNTAFVSGAVIERTEFTDLGDADMKRTPGHLPAWEDNAFGSGGVMMRGVSDSQIRNNRFQRLQNGQQTYQGQERNGDHLFHAVYARDNSNNNTVENNSFEDVSGDVIRVSNASDHNRIIGNTSQNAGMHGLVSNAYSTKNGEQNSLGTVVQNNRVGALNGSRTQGVAYHRSRQGAKVARKTDPAVRRGG